MKNKSILSVWHIAGSGKKKGYMHRALVIVALFAVGSIYAAKKTLTPAQLAAQKARGSVPGRKVLGQQAPGQHAPVGTARYAAQSTSEGWKLVGELSVVPVPWSPEVQAKYDQLLNQGKLSQEQNNIILANYKDKEALYQKWGYQQQPFSGQQQYWQQPQQPQIPFSPTGVAKGAGMLAAQGAQQGLGVWERVKGAASSLWQGVFGEYESSLGYFKYALPAAAFMAGGPVGWLSGAGLATTALMSGGSAAALLALTSAVDRLNFTAQTGGYASTASALEAIKEVLLLALGNDAAYPYLTAKKEALLDGLELYPVATDSTGIARKAHTELWQQYDNQLREAVTKNPTAITAENQFEKAVAEIRQKSRAASTPSYIANLQANNDLIKAQALVSEYNRALNRARMEAIRATGAQMPLAMPMQQAPIQQPVQQQVQQRPAQEPAQPLTEEVAADQL